MAEPVGERTSCIGGRLFSPTGLWVGTWVIAYIGNSAIFLASRQVDQPSPVAGSVAVVLQLAATAGLLHWLGRPPVESLAAAPVTRWRALCVVICLAVLALFPIGAAGLIVLVPIGAAAAIVLLVLRPHMSGREIRWAAVLGGVAAVGGLVEWLASGHLVDIGIALAQFPLVLLALLAGWGLARRVGWDQAGIGPSVYPSQGVKSALREFGFGFVVAAPWAFGNIAAGPFEEDDFRAGWQVLAALHPGVAEEAWARVFVIALLYWAFRRYARARTAVLIAALLGTYWFAFLHAPSNPVIVVLLGTIQVLPMTFLWLRRSLEAAIGFHVCIDLVRFFAAYLAFQGIWFI